MVDGRAVRVIPAPLLSWRGWLVAVATCAAIALAWFEAHGGRGYRHRIEAWKVERARLVKEHRRAENERLAEAARAWFRNYAAKCDAYERRGYVNSEECARAASVIDVNQSWLWPEMCEQPRDRAAARACDYAKRPPTRLGGYGGR